MAARNSVHQSRADGGQLVTGRFAAQAARFPLLPYEKQLIDLLGCSEEEYRYFRQEAERRGKARPAAYDHIPDVQAGPAAPILVSLFIGVAATVASVLLAPKPGSTQEEQIETTTQELADATGPSRYNTTYGFDGSAGIATWGEPISIPFGKFGGNSGGLLVTPKLVWSRLFSLGNQQLIKALYSCGEWGMAFPNIEGIYTGNAPLDSAYSHTFAVYFRQGEGDNRIQDTDLRYGTRGTPDSGDPETYPDIFTCPSRNGENDEAFCYTYTPSSNNTFGVSQSVVNGTGLRAMWRVISMVYTTGDEQKGKLIRDRIKICGNDWGSMPGVGREYVRGLGIVQYNGATYSERTDVQVSVNDEITYYIANGEYPDMYESSEYGTNLDDLNSTSESERYSADALLQLGATIQIGTSIWLVTGRAASAWEPGSDQTIILRCIDTFGAPIVTVLPTDLVSDLERVNEGQDFTTTNHVGLSSTALAVPALGIVKTVRQSDVVEIGLRSQVWNQASGMMNWSEVPTESQLVDFDRGNVQLSGGTMNKYLQRTSAFTISVRPGGQDGDGSSYEWEQLPVEFCIRGQEPVDQFNFLRFYLPETNNYEFRFEPLPGSIIVKNYEADHLFIHLDAKRQTLLTKEYSTAYGTFRMATAGVEVAQLELIGLAETGAPDNTVDYTSGLDASEVLLDRYETADYNDTHGKAHGWRGEVLGFPQLNQGITKSAVVRCLRSNGKSGYVDVEVTCTSLYQPQTLTTPDGYSPALYSAWIWDAPSFRVVGSAYTGANDAWEIGEELYYSTSITRDENNNNKWLHRAYTEGARTVTMYCTLQGIGDTSATLNFGTTDRNWIPASQISEINYYGTAWTTSCDSNPEHEISYVNEIRANEPVIPTYFNMSMFGLCLRSGKNFTKLDQLRFYVAGGIQVYRHLTGDVGRSNLFSDFVYWLLTDKDAGAGDRISEELVDSDSFVRTAQFLDRNKIFCDTVLQDAVNVRQYISDTAKMMLCNFTIINGKFGLEPALPTTSTGELSTEPVPIAMIFSEGNIIEGTFGLEYLEYEQRADFKAVATYRSSGMVSATEEYLIPAGLPEESTVLVRYLGEETGKEPIETFDMSTYCTQRSQALLVCKYLLAARRRIRYSVSFQTTPDGIALKPGDFIRVLTQATPYAPYNTGVVLADDNRVVTPTPLADGTYDVIFYRPGSEAVQEGQLVIVNGVATDPGLAGVVFSVPLTTEGNAAVFQVEQLTLTEEGLVDVVAVEHPCDDDLRSLIVQDMLDDQLWYVSE
jgi:hypothetical protein